MFDRQPGLLVGVLAIGLGGLAIYALLDVFLSLRGAPPDGRLFLAKRGDALAGSIALRRLDGESGEVKRLYVRPAYRGLGLGPMLARAVIDAARAIGYRRLVLDTLADMTAARALYQALGFREIGPYYENPLPGAIYMALELAPAG